MALLTGTIFGHGTVFGASDFWNRKAKGEWSSDEIRTLTTRSPWAKETRVEYKRSLQPNFDGTPGGLAMPGDPTNPIPGYQPGVRTEVPLGSRIGDASASPAGGARRNGQIPLEASAVIVRWESSQPERDATGVPLPEDFEGRYVISVTGLPPESDPNSIPAVIYKNSAFLQAKGKAPAQAGVVRYTKNGTSILFGFSKELLTLKASDKDVQFSINTGDVEIRARFDPKEMMYHGELAL